MEGWKIFTHDWKSPLQGGEPILLSTPEFPVLLPKVEVDSSSSECSMGWNFCHDIQTAAKIAGYWGAGFPSKIVKVRAVGKVVDRVSKVRSDQIEILRLASPEEILDSMKALVKGFTGSLVAEVATEQYAWYEALGRPNYDKKQVEAGLLAALSHRGLKNWTLKEFGAARDVRDAWAARDARAAWAAWDARDALTMFCAVRCFSLTEYNPNYLSFGLRDAYSNGLSLVIPIAGKTLGWSSNHD